MTPEWHAHVPCDHCGEVISVHDCIVVTKQLAQGDELTLHFCGESCATEFYLERLRRSEGQ